jgi:hypothetical protein
VKNKPLHEKVEWLYGSGDVRLLYGMAVPVLAVCALIALLALAPEWWLLPAMLLVVLVLAGIVLIGVTQMLDEGSDRRRRE